MRTQCVNLRSKILGSSLIGNTMALKVGQAIFPCLSFNLKDLTASCA